MRIAIRVVTFLAVLVLAVAAVPQKDAGVREAVLKQVQVPHHYYYREMYLPQLTMGPSSVAWSPDGKAVVYSMAGSLWRQAVDSGVAEQLTSGPGYDYQPDWSADGKWVVFAKYDKDAVELHALEVNSGKMSTLTSGGAVNVDPKISPDGKRIVFVSTQFNRRFHIFTGDFADGALTNVQRLTGETTSDLPRYYYSKVDHEISPAWSPDGKEILFIGNKGHLYGTGGIWRMRAEAGAEPREIHSEETSWKARPDWSPDGKRVAFSSYLGRMWHQLWGVPAEGGTAVPLTYGEYDNTAARWSRDGKRVAFISNRGGNTSLWILDALSGEQTQVVAKQRKYRVRMGQLGIMVMDARGDLVPSRISVTDANGRAYAPDDAWMHADEAFVRGERASEAHYFHSPGGVTLMIPIGKVRVDVMRGFEYALETTEFDPQGIPGPPWVIKFRLKPLRSLADAAGRWASGDLHVHMNYGGAYRATPKTLVRQAEAENLSIVHNLIVNKETRIPDVEHFTGKLDPASTSDTLLWHGQEFHTSSWGHLGFLGLTKHLILPDYVDYPRTVAASLYPTNAMVAKLAQRQGALVGYVHPFDDPVDLKAPRVSYALPVSVALGSMDYFEVMGFSDHHITAGVWYRLLNCGFRIPAGAGTDAMTNFASLRGPVGLVRAYVRVPSGPLTMSTWLDGLKQGRTFVTNGPLLEFSLGGKAIGDELKLPAGGGELKFTASLRSIVPLDHFEVVCNGKVAREIPLTGEKTKGDASGMVRLERSGWCVLRAWKAKPAYPILDLYPYATTSPIYVTVGDAPARSPEDAAYFLAWIDRVEEFARGHKGWNTEAEREAVLAEIAAAKRVFQERQK
jgi:Tol biopolymer transport system component